MKFDPIPPCSRGDARQLGSTGTHRQPAEHLQIVRASGISYFRFAIRLRRSPCWG